MSNSNYDHETFLETLNKRASKTGQEEVFDMGNNTIFYVSSDNDIFAEPMNEEELELAREGNFEPFFVNVTVYYNGIKIGYDTLGNCLGYHPEYIVYRDEMISGITQDVINEMIKNTVATHQQIINTLSN